MQLKGGLKQQGSFDDAEFDAGHVFLTSLCASTQQQMQQPAFRHVSFIHKNGKV